MARQQTGGEAIPGVKVPVYLALWRALKNLRGPIANGPPAIGGFLSGWTSRISNKVLGGGDRGVGGRGELGAKVTEAVMGVLGRGHLSQVR
jgi:hypothetical protein